MNDDVKNLFKKFGSQEERYQEIQREEASTQAQQRWPLLREVHIHAEPADAPRSFALNASVSPSAEPALPAEAARGHNTATPARPSLPLLTPAPVLRPIKEEPEVRLQTRVGLSLFRSTATHSEQEEGASPRIEAQKKETVQQLFARLAHTGSAPVSEAPLVGGGFFRKIFKP